jgi:hypothetical protein
MNDHNAEDSRLPEDAAHRLLARAVELDAAHGTELTIAQLRGAAREAGISETAFDSALREWQSTGLRSVVPSAAPSGTRSWLGLRLAEFVDAVTGAPVRNIVAFAAFWGVLMLLVSLDRAADVHWLVRKATDPVALAIGTVIALRLRARPVGLLLAGLAIAQGAVFVMDAALRTPAVHGFGSHMALMIAGVAGVLLGGRVFNRPPSMHTSAVPTPAFDAPTPVNHRRKRSEHSPSDSIESDIQRLLWVGRADADEAELNRYTVS